MYESIRHGETNVYSHEPWQTLFQIPLYKLFLVMAAYAVSFAMFGSNEIWRVVVATWFGTAVGAWILAVRSRADLVRSAIAAGGCLVGIVSAVELTPVEVYIAQFTLTVGHDIMPIVFGAVGGAFLFAWTSRIVVKRENQR